MSGKRFQYALEPLLLTRQWDLDALMLELNEQNVAVASQEAAIAALRERMLAANDDWRDVAGGAQGLPVERFVRYMRYMGDLGKQVSEQESVLASMVEVRDELTGRIISAKRGLDAVEEHRGEMKAKFVQFRLSGDFKIADDQWNTLQTGKASNGS